MERFLENLLTASIHGSIVILAVIALRLVLRKTPKKYICLLWLLAGIRLLMPIEIRSDLSLQPEFTLPIAGLSGLKWGAILPWIWAAVACGFGLYSLVSYLKLKNQVREAVRIRGGWESDRIDTAFILGFIKPRIFIPMGMTKQSRKHILEHERTHLDKGDHWIKMVGFLALSLHWFNPLVWIAYIMLCKDIEMACDERVVQFMELEERKSYSAALLSCSSRQMHFAASPVAFGEVSVKQRILSVLNYKKPSFWISLLGVVAFFFVAVCLVTSPSAQAELPVLESLSPEEQAQLELLQKCHDDLEAILGKEEFYYVLNGCDEQGSVLWNTGLYKKGGSTMWKYTPSTRPDVEDGHLELNGQHYAYQSGNWIQTDSQDTGFENWLNLYRWDLNGAEFQEEIQEENNRSVVFTTKWVEEDQTVHTSTATYSYNAAGELQSIRIKNSNHPTSDRVFLETVPSSQIFGEAKEVSDFFTEAEAAIADGVITSEELAVQAEYNAWGIFFRVDDDRLSSAGADIFISQGDHGQGGIFTTERYWIEKQIDGNWERLPTVNDPKWSNDYNVGVSKGASSYGYLDWTPIYGKLEAGEYRMGKMFKCYDRKTGYSKEHVFYSEFTIMEAVDASSPEAKAAVERCYTKLEELKRRESIHWLSIQGSESQDEYWVNGDNYLKITHYNGPNAPKDQWPEKQKTMFPRTDTSARYDGIGYSTARENPDILTSKVLGMKLSTLSPNRAGWIRDTIAEDFGMSYFERGNQAITFPEGIGVVSDEMVRFVESWTIAGGGECQAQLTYRFDEEGTLFYMEYKTDLRKGRTYICSIEVFDDTAAEIDAKIKPYTENLIVGSFSWEEAKVKYTGEEFNIQENNFVNNGGSPINGPVDAAKLALNEYPDLGEYLSVDAFRDESTGMWKVTIEGYANYQDTYVYRDIYLTDSGATQLLVCEGPIRFDEPRK